MKFPPRTAACLLLIACAIAQTAQAIATSSGSLAGSLQRMPASNTHFSALPESRGAGAGAPRAVEEGRSGSNVAAAVCGEGLKLRGGRGPARRRQEPRPHVLLRQLPLDPRGAGPGLRALQVGADRRGQLQAQARQQAGPARAKQELPRRGPPEPGQQVSRLGRGPWRQLLQSRRR
eukprot:CAMPEP_0206281260 /NCGR_PEP_ID=MMETSP0047_2-20121206/39035_1 /ASSEMBLY_ACC=CAM_ASM_000192 /TAXON_ID=195065 /ORGANISM="Chroomonas mesostigmatica_cf, Strain CCMP1168" /LENGTH=175 /DNA_ID=CAMNT_0053711413 /DNA_START=120 /DNA_END=647 /DNA_ORIENTATION=-